MTTFSRHAERRAQQRGMSWADVKRLLDHADIYVPVGNNCWALRVHRRTARVLEGGDRLCRYAVVVNDDNGEIVTIVHHRRGARGRRYRKGVA